jgi:hypothetical protein
MNELVTNEDYMKFKDNKEVKEVLLKAKSDNFISVFEGIEINNVLKKAHFDFDKQTYKNNIVNL